MERYVWAAVVAFIATLAAATALILGGKSAELERFALLAAQGAGFLLNFYLVFRSNKNTEKRIRETVDNGVKDAVEKGLDTAVKMTERKGGQV
jgi:hypothetical protein